MKPRVVLSPTTVTFAILCIGGFFGVPVRASPAADVGKLNGQWEMRFLSIDHDSEGSKSTKGKQSVIAKLTDCADSSSSALCLEFKDSDGSDVVLQGSRFGDGFFLKSPDGAFVVSGIASNPKAGFAWKLRGVGSRMTDSNIQSISVMGRRLGN